MPVAWTSEAAVLRALGDSGAASDPYLTDVVDAANVWAWMKRFAAGYVDDDTDQAPAPNAAVALGTTTFAVDLYRARGSTDVAASYAEIDGFATTYGNWPTIKRLLGIGRALVDPPPPLTAVPAWRRRAWVR